LKVKQKGDYLWTAQSAATRVFICTMVWFIKWSLWIFEKTYIIMVLDLLRELPTSSLVNRKTSQKFHAISACGVVET